MGMDVSKFREVSDQLAGRLSVSLITIALLSLVIVLQQVFINSRSEIVIERPMFQGDKEIKYVRDQLTESVAVVWAYNAVMIFGNVSPENYNFVRAAAYSMLGSDVSARLKVAHDRQVLKMNEQKISITFIPEDAQFDEKRGVLTIAGIHVIRSLVKDEKKSKPQHVKYQYQVKVALMCFRPYVDDWKEGTLE